MKVITAAVCITLYLSAQSSISHAGDAEQCLLNAFKQAEPTSTIQELKDLCALAIEPELVNTAVVVLDAPIVLKQAVVETDSLDIDAAPAITIGEVRMARLKNNSSLITPYNRNYILPFSYSDKLNPEPFQQLYPEADLHNLEVKFQLSIQAKAADNVLSTFGSDVDLDLWASYTQRSWWQLYNTEQSAPFRETNYQPEVFFRLMRDETDNKILGFKNRLVSFGFIHQSNGRGSSLSRSWNRLFMSAEFDKGNLLIMPRIWWRIPEDEEDDDNPDLYKYVGYGDLKIAYELGDHLLSTTITNNLETDENRGGVQLDWTFPFPWTTNKRFKAYVQYFNGYGESLIDYNQYTQRVSVGVVLTDWN
jgi:phospholipase A1